MAKTPCFHRRSAGTEARRRACITGSGSVPVVGRLASSAAAMIARFRAASDPSAPVGSVKICRSASLLELKKLHHSFISSIFDQLNHVFTVFLGINYSKDDLSTND
ncbi:MAG: hypothetical protein AAFX81_05790 [Pseudomonadota bacterium]